MSITKTPSGKWNARYPVGGGEYGNKVFEKQRDAQAHEAKMREMVRGGATHDPKMAKQAVEAFAWAWFEMKNQNTPNYQQNVRSHIKNHLVLDLGKRALGSVTPHDLQKMINRMEAAGMVPTTIRTIMTTVSMIFRYAKRKNFILQDPTLELDLPKVVERQIKPLQIPQVRLIADNIFPRYRALVLFAAGSGLRQGEAFAVKVTDINWTKGEGSVTVYNQIQSYTGAAQTETVATKNRKDRTVPLADEVLDLLREHLAMYPPVKGYIFTNTLGAPIHRRVFDRAFDAARRRSALAYRVVADEQFENDPVELALAYGQADQILDAVFHSLRHFYASLLIRMGLSPKAVAARLGHANVMLTLSRYTHLWPDDEGRTREATQILFVG